jgi:hypothetical protein
VTQLDVLSPANLVPPIDLPPLLGPINTIADYVEAAVTPYVAPDLISLEAMSHIRQIAGRFPGALTDFFGFECPLGTVAPAADFLVCAKSSEGGREILAGERPGREIPDAFRRHPVWRRIRAFANEWHDSGSPLFDGVHNIWVEFDIKRSPDPIPAPSVFLGSNDLRPPASANRDEMPPRCEWLTGAALPLLMGSAVDPAVERQIARCLNLLPPEAFVFQVGVMLARASEIVRLCVRGIRSEQIAPYLESLSWTGSRAALEDLLTQFGPLTGRIDLDLDVADRIMPKIGLECYPQMSRAATAQLLDRLVASGLAVPAKAQGVTAYRGMAHERLTPERWPLELLALSGIFEGRLHSAFVRWLHHVKIVLQPDVPLEAKAYLAVLHRWFSPGELKSLLHGGVV